MGKTVYVIGAGASKEANLPTGYELKSKISSLLDIRFKNFRQISGDQLITQALKVHVSGSGGENADISPHLHEAWHIRDALPQAISIDNFIDAHQDNDKIAICGKLAIVRSILSAEKNSLLYFKGFQRNPNINFSSLEETWYLPFFQLLTENCTKSNLKDRFQSIVFIIFNYDRCVEHFLYHALQNYYRVSETEAYELISCINIYHPYGSVGSLPWLKNGESMGFGVDPSSEQLLQLTKKIKTFTEGTDPESSDISAIRKHMGDAHRLVFLGFAFHKLNMQLITSDKQKNADYSQLKCYATAYKISDSDKEVISEQISKLYESGINTRMTNNVCHAFFAEFWRSLAFE